MESESSSPTCTRCKCIRLLEDFIVKNDILAQKENLINLSDVTDFIYYALLKYNSLNDNLEGQARFQLQFYIDLDSIYENIPTDIVLKEKNSYITDLIINKIILLVLNETSQENISKLKSGYQLANKDVRIYIKNLITKHFNRHILIPKEDGSFINDQHIIWIEYVTEMYQYCLVSVDYMLHSERSYLEILADLKHLGCSHTKSQDYSTVLQNQQDQIRLPEKEPDATLVVQMVEAEPT
ncbi:6248_t:CDS:2 [Cetraspora pellucida]|uniref:6248_t:CDS:1 n=1 Tax=Cetraspora pellucida TaxID=1433469 RepID=A0A9N8YSS3_9GLOM|nr:6248_t:CDS:2 [Cetraspora pellucida]